MICFWHNDALCLRPEDNKEHEALATIHCAFLAGLKPRLYGNVAAYEEAEEDYSQIR